MMNMLKFGFALVLTILVSACAGPVVVPQAQTGGSDGAQVSARAEARWKAMIAKDLDSAYTFLSPGSKALNSAEIYKGKIKPLNWKSAKVVSTGCEQDKCQVRISLTFTDQRMGGDVTTVFEETWLKDSNQWWLVFN